MKLKDLKKKKLEELRADLEPHLGRAITPAGDTREDLEDALRSVLDNVMDTEAPELLELLESYGVSLEEEDAPQFDHPPTPEEIDRLAKALDSDNANNIASALAAIMATPVPARKDPRKELARWALAQAEPVESSASESDAQPEEEDAGPDAQEGGQEEGSVGADAPTLVILQLMCRPSGVPGLWDRDILINPEAELEHQIRSRYPHSELGGLEAVRSRLANKIGRINRQLSNLDGVEV